MSGKHRMTAGRFEDVRERAAKVQCDGAFASPDAGHATTLARLKKAAVERVRRRFGKAGLGNKHSRVFSARLSGKDWRDIGIPRATFFHALKKIEISFRTDKHWVKLMSALKKRRSPLD